MQAAVDCNGSSSSSTTTTITNDNDDDILLLERTNASVILAPPATLNNETTLTLRHRFPANKLAINHNYGATTNAYSNVHVHLIQAANYLGRRVKQIYATTRPKPQVLPSEHVNESTEMASLPTLAATSFNRTTDVAETNESSSSTTVSDLTSLSLTSSVIVTPIRSNGNAAQPAAAAALNVSNGSCDSTTALEDSFAEPLDALTVLPKHDEQCASVAESINVVQSPLLLSSLPTSMAKPFFQMPATLRNSIDAQLLQWQDMPQYLQFNPYVLSGYRPLTTFKGCLLSLFYWHNETINILTHAIPIIYILATVPGLMPWERGHRFLSFCHVFGSVAPWCGSFVYHLFMNIEKGENVYYRLLKLDMVGIWVSQSFGAMPLVTATTFCFSYKWKWLIIISYCLLSFWGLYKALTASSPWQRRLCFALPFTMRWILTFLRIMGLIGGNRVVMSHVYLQDGVSILGGAIGAMHIPEKWFPGLVDYYLNSHNIMHVLVVVAVYSMHQATMKDIEWMSTATCANLINSTSASIESSVTPNMEL